ncbi:MAG TPA: TIGR00730 family Rossman fold protein [Dehalococcoidia bacterium]|nr:TIGR00730 family Rossman fold protein [Dehalococcoidia bacterium]
MTNDKPLEHYLRPDEWLEDPEPGDAELEAADAEQGAIEPLEPASRRPRTPVQRRVYSTGNEDLDRLIQEIILSLSSGAGLEGPVPSADLELTREMLTSSVRLILRKATRAELKLVNTTLKEFAYSFRVFAPYRGQRKVSIFGSARVEPGDPNYMTARNFATEIARRGWMVITGAGPGIMAAGHQGAGAKQSFGANIRLPTLNPANIYIAKDGKLINFKYFFTRKVTFMKESSAFVLLPGGWGTLDEAFELLTLTQTGKSDLHPIVLLEPPGSTYWRSWVEFIRDEVLAHHYLLESDMALLRIATTPLEAVEEIERFYHNYRSARFVGDRLVLRLQRAPDDAALQRLNHDFADLLEQGSIDVIEPLPVEVRDNDEVDAARIALYPQHRYGRVRQLIDALNAL